ncbi:uncharacterized protein J7T54_003736 [Emericellopsis cladophorae]|uniref:NAD-dependent epimerase/dehydratase domain-containing protein n=1 Tax=Emericellopsis cladophorae TaxID=2686198 RepID=A0A9Q0BBZ4_9HYPO|nr:uncharacterized protein J7T54_003736 [Emericellopsis cladophorae]KAI6779812.1 hypothetical protein J7T54_003736 [Emericellopsis cladophorae]
MSLQLLLITGVSGHRKPGQIKAPESIKPYLAQFEFTVVPDLLDPGAFDGVIDGADGVVHVASPLPYPCRRDLIDPAVNATIGVVKSEGPFPNAMAAYGVSKAAAHAATASVHVNDVARAYIDALNPAFKGNRHYLVSSGGLDGTTW